MANTDSTQIKDDKVIFTPEELFSSLKYSFIELGQAIYSYRQHNADDKFLLSIINKFVESLTEKLEIEKIGKFGDTVRFNPELHTPESGQIGTGTEVMIVVPGFQLRHTKSQILPVVRPIK